MGQSAGSAPPPPVGMHFLLGLYNNNVEFVVLYAKYFIYFVKIKKGRFGINLFKQLRIVYQA